MHEFSILFHTHSAWDLLNHQEVSVSRLSEVLPEHAQTLTGNPAITARLGIEGIYYRYKRFQF